MAINPKGQPIRPADTKQNLTRGQIAADKVTQIVGSWGFIISVLTGLTIWIIINGIALIWAPWDPYPFILLNFVLSCLAAIQAPIILMSQNRDNQRGNIRAEYDYLINRKTEREVQTILCEIQATRKAIQRLQTTANNIHKHSMK